MSPTQSERPKAGSGGGRPRFSVLWPEVVARSTSAEDPAYFVDLNLDQVLAAIIAGYEEYDLAGVFRVPLADTDEVTYRQEILRDLERPGVFEVITGFGREMRTFRGEFARAQQMYYRHQRERWFLQAVNTYWRAVRDLGVRIERLELCSRALTGLSGYLRGYTVSGAFTRLGAQIEAVERQLDGVHYCMQIKGNRIHVTSYEGEVDYSSEVSDTSRSSTMTMVRITARSSTNISR